MAFGGRAKRMAAGGAVALLGTGGAAAQDGVTGQCLAGGQEAEICDCASIALAEAGLGEDLVAYASYGQVLERQQRNGAGELAAREVALLRTGEAMGRDPEAVRATVAALAARHAEAIATCVAEAEAAEEEAAAGVPVAGPEEDAAEGAADGAAEGPVPGRATAGSGPVVIRPFGEDPFGANAPEAGEDGEAEADSATGDEDGDETGDGAEDAEASDG